MESLVAIGIDVHKDKFALVAILLILGAQDQILGEIEVGPDYKELKLPSSKSPQSLMR